VSNAITETGFVTVDDKGNPVGTGEGGCEGFIKWLALHEPKTAAALLARILPYYITSDVVPTVAMRTDHSSPDSGASTVFKEGYPKYGGRAKGARNKLGGDYGGRRKGTGNNTDLRQMIVDAIHETGFVGKDDKGNPIGTGDGGCKGFIKWLALYEPKTAAALFARVLPHFKTVTEASPVASRSEIEAEFKEPGLPVTLIEHLQKAPAPLDLDEDPDPWGLHSSTGHAPVDGSE